MRRNPVLRNAVVSTLVAWSAIIGSIWLIASVLIFFTYLQGPVNSGDVPESLPEAIAWSAVVGPYFIVLAAPFTIPIAAAVGTMTALFRRVRSRATSPLPV